MSKLTAAAVCRSSATPVRLGLLRPWEQRRCPTRSRSSIKLFVTTARFIAQRTWPSARHAGPVATAAGRSATGSLTSLREKLIKIGAKVISHGRYVTNRGRIHRRFSAAAVVVWASGAQAEPRQWRPRRLEG